MSLPLTPFDRWLSGTNQNSIPANNNSLRVEVFSTDGVADDVTAQPAFTSPADDGKWYIIPAGATGAQWATFAEDSVAIFYGGTWYEFIPAAGNMVLVAGVLVVFDAGTGWEPLSVPASFTGGALTSALDEAKGSNIASASTTNIAGATGNLVHVTGTTTITALGTAQAGTERVVVFDGILTLTHNATSLILPTGANITTAAGDVAIFRSEGSGNWRCVVYQRKDGTALSGSGRAPSIQAVTSAATVTPTFADDMVKVTAQAAALALANPTGSAIPGLGIVIRIKDNGTARAISYGTQYRAIGVNLPTTTVINKTLYLAMIYNSDDTKWDVVAVGQEA